MYRNVNTEYTLVNIYEKKKKIANTIGFYGQLIPVGHLQTQILELSKKSSLLKARKKIALTRWKTIKSETHVEHNYRK